MDISQAQSSTSLLGRVLDWLAHLERAADMQPVDYLERRVAELEQRLDHLLAARPTKEV